MPTIYGVDTTKKVTSILVRDAIVACFAQAHCSQTELQGDAKTQDNYCKEIVKKAFAETNGNYENPTKDSIVASIKWLAHFSESFRDEETIKQHFFEITSLVNQISE